MNVKEYSERCKKLIDEHEKRLTELAAKYSREKYIEEIDAYSSLCESIDSFKQFRYNLIVDLRNNSILNSGGDIQEAFKKAKPIRK